MEKSIMFYKEFEKTNKKYMFKHGIFYKIHITALLYN